MNTLLQTKLKQYIRRCREHLLPEDQIVQRLEKAGVHKDIAQHLLKKVELEEYFIYDEHKLVEEKQKIEKAQEEFRKGSSLKVDDVMSFPVQTIEQDQSIKKAISLMTEKGIGALVVTNEGKPVGMVSERDLLVKVLDKDLEYKKCSVEHIMTEPIIAAEKGESLIEVETKMKLNGIRRIPILESGELVGIITSSDIIRIMAFI